MFFLRVRKASVDITLFLFATIYVDILRGVDRISKSSVVSVDRQKENLIGLEYGSKELKQ